MAQDLTGLNSLRQALTPYEDVKFELNLNRHPKAHKNKSIVYAENMKLSKDGSVLENEESVEINQLIIDTLNNYYNKNNYQIIHIIPCNTELVLFVKNNLLKVFDIWRYREQTNKYNEECALFYNKGILYNYGNFSGTFTYTSNDSLIIAFCEYNSTNKNIMNPMMTINLGTFTKGYINDNKIWNSSVGEFNDRELETYKLPICPEVCIPKIINDYKINNKSYCGNYYFYIRYKINEYDYTQWFNIGYPILNEQRTNKLIHNKVLSNEQNKDFNNEDLLGAYQSDKSEGGIYINVNENSDLINNSIVIELEHNNLLYDKCQIGYICIANTYTKYYHTNDISLTKQLSFSTNIEVLIEEIFNVSLYNNFYNVKNIINKDNKLYISNYELNNIKIDDSKLNNIVLGIEHNKLTIDTFKTPKPVKYKINNAIFEIDKLCKKVIKSVYSELNFTNRIKPSDNNSIRVDRTAINLVTFLKHIKSEGYVTNEEYYIDIKNSNRHGNAIFTYRYKLDELFICVEKCTSIESSYSSQSYKDVTLFYLYSDNINKPIDHKQIDKTSYDTLISDNDCVINFDNYPYNNGSFILGEMDVTLINSSNTDVKIELNKLISFDKWDDDYWTHNIEPEKVLNIYNSRPIDNFNRDNIVTSLVPGEIYDFYIHFVDKYGEYTDGFRLSNFNEPSFLCNVIVNNKSVFYDYACIINVFGKTYVVSNPDRNFITKDSNDNTIVNIDPNETIYKIDRFVQNGNTIDCYGIIADGTEDSVMDIINAFYYILDVDYDILKDIKLVDIFDCAPIKIQEGNRATFLPFFNKNGHSLFRVPYYIYAESDIDFYTHSLTIENVEDICNFYGFTSYFITYKKLEKVNVFDGLGDYNSITNTLLNVNYSTASIARILNFDENNQLTYNDSKIGFAFYRNCIGFYHANCNILYADSGIDNFKNKQTMLLLSDNNRNESIDYVILNNINKNIYTSSNNILYRLGNINNKFDIKINRGLNGIVKNHTAIFYGSGDEGVITLQTDIGFTSFGNVSLYDIYNIYDDDNNIPYLTELPKTLNVYNKDKTFKGTDVYYEVINTLNNINYKSGNLNYTNINVYTIYNDHFLKEFNRTIYRSQVISDEGRTNNWRYFENDAYKNIEENKGNITNLLAIGNYLYVHTEHSLFAFSEDNTLSMNNQNLQVATPDIFDTEYKEVFITKLGYGGLQDKNAWIAGQFGYIWFDEDSKKIFKIYGNSMDIISNDIQEWLDNADIYDIRFANDIKNNRILIYFVVWNNDEEEINVIISYNILSKTFISFHSNTWFKSYNTKNNLYYLTNNTTIAKYNKDSYGKNLNDKKNYSVSFIINPYYKEIKYLEHIIFKLTQRNIRDINDSFGIIKDYIQFPVEKGLLPLQPKSIRVYNDLVDTGIIECTSIDDNNMPKNNVENYQTPYWDLGNWNFSFLRDIKHYPNDDYENPESRLFGNYFVISFDFGNVNTLIEFENLDIQLTKDKNL